MKLTPFLVLGMHLALQTLGLSFSSTPSAKTPAPTEIRATESTTVVPIFYREQARQLLDRRAAQIPTVYDRASGNFVSEEKLATHLAVYVEGRSEDLLPAKWKTDSLQVSAALIESANHYKMDPLFLMAVAVHESRFNPEARGLHGEIGIMQIKPSTARAVLQHAFSKPVSEADAALALEDPAQNIMIGAAYLAHLRSRLRGHTKAYITAYNMGLTNLNHHLREGVKPRIYTDMVLAEYTGLTKTFVN
jgi:hypothetical protein